MFALQHIRWIVTTCIGSVFLFDIFKKRNKTNLLLAVLFYISSLVHGIAVIVDSR